MTVRKRAALMLHMVLLVLGMVPAALAAQQPEPSRGEIIRQVAKDFGISPAAVEKEPWSKILDQDNWYHKCRVLQWPAFDRASTRTVAPAGGQGDYVCTGADDDLQIQKAIDSLPKEGGKIVLLPGTYLLGNCIRLKDNTELEIRGTLKVADAVTSPLTADAQPGQTTVHVADARRFRVAQWVTLMDDDPRKEFHGGRKYGESVAVRSIQGNTLTVSDPLAVKWAKTRATSSESFSVDGYRVAKKAYVTTSHSAVLVLENQRVYIHGSGKSGAIDGNKAGQSPTSPLMCTRLSEDLRASCGIGIVDSSWVKVEGLYVHDANLHNIALDHSHDCEVTGVEAARSNDKNICLLDVAKTRLTDNYCHDAVVEDGICCHSPIGPYIVIARNRTVGNPRYGIHLGFGSHYSIVARNVSYSNGIDFGKWDKPGHAIQIIKGLLTIENSFRSAVKVEVPAAGRTTIVKATKTALEVRLGTGVTLRGAFDGENFLGIGEVRLGNLVLHAAEAPLWAPLLQGEPAVDYQRCELMAAEPQCAGREDGVALRLRLVAADGSADEVRWRLWPHRVRMSDLNGVGFGYAFQASTAGRTLRGITDRTVWGLAGTAAGLTVLTHQTYSAANRFLLGPAGGPAGGGGRRFVHADPLDFQTGPEGSLITYFDRPGFVDETTSGVSWGVRVWDAFHLPWGKTVETSPKYVVFTPARGDNAWVAARDYVVGICRQAYGIRSESPLPLVNVSTLQYDVKPESKIELQRIADRDVPEFHRLGFKRIYLGPVWEGVVCGPDRIAVAERHGGEAALKRLCDAAHRADMQVIAWLAPGHLWCKSSIFKAHPDWELRGRDGKPPTMYCWPTLRGVDLTTPYADYFVQSVRGLHDRTGLDGLWLDSYASFTHFIQTADPQFPLRQGEALWRLHGRLHQLGLVTYVEGNACYGIKSVNFPWSGDPQRPAFADPVLLDDCSPYTGPGSGPGTETKAAYLAEADHYYRLLANKCCVFVYHNAFGNLPGALERIGQANRDYNSVVAWMQRRVLLTDDRGVQWNSQGVPKVLFAFRDFEYRLPGLQSASDVTTGRRLDVPKGIFRTEKQHTYLLRLKGTQAAP